MTTTNDDTEFAVELCDAIRTIAAKHGYAFQSARVNNDFSDDHPVFWDRLWANRGDVEHPDYRYLDVEFAICAPKEPDSE